MRLISKVRIEGFRSIRSAELSDLQALCALAGPNNSGKSNVLRALNAFFNDETDHGVPLEVDRDYFRHDLGKKKAKKIRVEITFSLPANFRFRKGLEPVRQLLGGSDFRIAKEWTRKRPEAVYYLNGHAKEDLDDRLRLAQFLQLIRFRYIPNRVLPIDVIKKEHQALRDVLIRRLGAKVSKKYQPAFKAIQRTSEKLIQGLTKRFRSSCPEQGVRLATPSSWNEMLFNFGYRLTSGDVEIEDTAQGSGIQSLLMLETLYLIDKDFFQQFGWQQASIWAVEEPESSFHSSLEAQMAAFLASISSDPNSRLQIICTTHSDLVVQYSGTSVFSNIKDGVSLYEPGSDPRAALQKLAEAGISRWAHPLLHFPLDPLILVEGKYDASFVEESLKFIKPKRRVRVAYLGQLGEADQTGGVEALRNYLRENAAALRVRRPDSPVVVILDWDARGKEAAFRAIAPNLSTYRVVAVPDSALNPKLGKTFRGVERSFPDRLIHEAETVAKPEGIEFSVTRSSGVYSADKDTYGRVKEILNQQVKRGLQESDLVHVRPFIEEVLKSVDAL